ncbi:hypothetical protein ACGH52_05595 [Streptomyces sp. BBFR25]|uniref:hypothetical protein n=1 Tax=Streptomyces sp. BBFR25 TaxID=3372855 RepID=UPI0037DC713B
MDAVKVYGGGDTAVRTLDGFSVDFPGRLDVQRAAMAADRQASCHVAGLRPAGRRSVRTRMGPER